jgi:F-type H+-transporting ATPase subunit alpha
LELGRRLTELLKQSQYQPVVMEKQVVSLYAVNNGYMDDVAVEKVRDFEQKLIEYLETQDKGILEAIRDTKELTEDIEAKLKTALERFKQSYS